MTDATVSINGYEPGYQVEGAEETGCDSEPSIYVHAQFVGGDPTLTRIRDISITIPVRSAEGYADYAVVVEATVAAVGRLGQLPGYGDLKSVEISTGAGGEQ